MKVVCVQFWPFHAQIDKNIKKIQDLLSRNGFPLTETVETAVESRSETNVNLIILPEMAVTGYIFDHPRQVKLLIDTEIPKAIAWFKQTGERNSLLTLFSIPVSLIFQLFLVHSLQVENIHSSWTS